ncbi:amidase family protein [Halothiobacillus sp.]|uniref:amidase family protein n=1 Tax=Halothiobacillus sp. TaxID=1891311 RepID=UPI002622134B|nr:amidase family protein [Halothiobacillus sp.]
MKALNHLKSSFIRAGALLTISASLSTAPVYAAKPFAVEETSVAEIEAAFKAKTLTCHQLVANHLARIEAYDRQGPSLRALLTINSNALAKADQLDAAYAKSGPVGPLHCIPLILKDNYNTADMPTTDGSASMAYNQPAKDAFVVSNLRAAGALILAKANMHEFAVSGTTVSSLGGQTLNPYDLTRTPGGSSGGTAAAIAASFGVVGTGSDTVNSIRSPASATALVGFRPTRGLLSRDGIIPVSETQDAIGPITRTVADAALMLAVMKGVDPNDPATEASAGKSPKDYLSSLDANGLKGARIGVIKTMFGTEKIHDEVNAVMSKSIETMKTAGATIIEINDPRLDANLIGKDNDVQKYEFAALIKNYLASVPNTQVHSVQDILASGKYHAASTGKFLKSAADIQDGLHDPDYLLRLQRNIATRKVVEKVLEDHHLDALIYPLQKRLVVPVDELNQADRNGILASVTGMPVITVPAGFSTPSDNAPLGVPIGMDILGKAWSEPTLLKLAYAFEQVSKIRKPPASTPPLD